MVLICAPILGRRGLAAASVLTSLMFLGRFALGVPLVVERRNYTRALRGLVPNHHIGEGVWEERSSVIRRLPLEGR